MNICLCMKQVPDTSEIKADPATNSVVLDGVPSIVNPFDTYAQEAGVRLKEKLGGKLIVVSMGSEKAKDAIKSCYAVGADDGYLISDDSFAESDTLVTSHILSEAIKVIEEKEGIKFDLILCGNKSADGATGQVAPQIAERLNLPQITCALDVEEADGSIRAKRDCDEGYDILSVGLPAVVTVVKLPYEPRYPTIKSKMAAKKKEIKVLTAADLPNIDTASCGPEGSPTKIHGSYIPVKDTNGIKIAGVEASDAAKQLVDLISEAKLL